MKPIVTPNKIPAGFTAAFAAAVALALSCSPVQADVFTWTQNSPASQAWTAAGNWTPNNVFTGNAADDLIFFASATVLLDGINNITGSVPATLAMNSLTLSGRGNTATASSVTVNLASSASTWSTATVNLNGVNNLSNGTPASGLYLNYNLAANLTLTQATTQFTGNGSAEFLVSGNIGEAAAGYAITKTGSSILTLSGTNAWTGGTSVNGGGLIFRNLASKAATGTHAFAANTTVGLGVLGLSGSGFFTATDVDNAFANTMTGNLAGITRDAAANIGIDTTDGDFAYSTSIPGSPANGLVKMGVNTLTLTGTNTYTGLPRCSAARSRWTLSPTADSPAISGPLLRVRRVSCWTAARSATRG